MKETLRILWLGFKLIFIDLPLLIVGLKKPPEE